MTSNSASTGVVLQCVSSALPDQFIPGKFYDAERVFKNGAFAGFAVIQSERHKEIAPEDAHLAERLPDRAETRAIITEKGAPQMLGLYRMQDILVQFKVIEL